MSKLEEEYDIVLRMPKVTTEEGMFLPILTLSEAEKEFKRDWNNEHRNWDLDYDSYYKGYFQALRVRGLIEEAPHEGD